MTEYGAGNQIGFGYLATTPVALFGLFDKWREGKYPASLDVEEAIKRAV